MTCLSLRSDGLNLFIVNKIRICPFRKSYQASCPRTMKKQAMNKRKQNTEYQSQHYQNQVNQACFRDNNCNMMCNSLLCTRQNIIKSRIINLLSIAACVAVCVAFASNSQTRFTYATLTRCTRYFNFVWCET